MKPRSAFSFLQLGASIAILLFSFQLGAQSSAPGTASDSLDINNINCRINVLGDNFHDLTNEKSGFTAPKGSGKHTIYASSLWVGGYEHNNLKLAAMTYRQSGVDFFPGPLDTTNASISADEMKKWDKVWKITRADVQSFIADPKQASQSIIEWPGNASAANEGRTQAPFIDLNHNGIYEPEQGDYPDMKGDEMLWWVFNDKGGLHTETKGDAMGIEVNASAFAFNSDDDALKNTVFCSYRIINRGSDTLKSAHIAIWTDFDIGYAFDDYVGCDSANSAYFGYNGHPYDSVYHKDIPVQSVLFLNRPLERFMALGTFSLGFPNSSPADFFTVMNPMFKNGSSTTNMQYSGAPEDSMTAWNEHNAGNKPADRRAIGGIGPLTINPGQAIDLQFAYVFAQKKGGNLADNMNLSRQYWDRIRKVYNSNYTYVHGYTGAAQKMEIYPNPASGNVSLNLSNTDIKNITVTDPMGRLVYHEQVQPGSQNMHLNISGWAAGVYTVQASGGKGYIAQKLIIANK